MSLSRRNLLKSAAGLAATITLMRSGTLPALAEAPFLYEPFTPFREDHVKQLAKALAAKPFEEQKSNVPAELSGLTYDQYRDIYFNPDRVIWKGDPAGFGFDMFHTGFLYNSQVDIHVIDGDKQAKLKYDPSLFKFGDKVKPPDGKTDLHYAGLRLHYTLTSPTISEFAVFQGASYFRAIAKGLSYGLSARGLAIDTGQPTGEEFPAFKSFWVKKPDLGTGTIVVHALLDSPSVTGAYRFAIKPGDDTQMDIEVTLYPRKDLAHVGIAPLTSMFVSGPLVRPVEDFREAIHDSDGLMMINGRGEWIWRPLNNPKTLQVSAFEDLSPRGFGLMQRGRAYADYRDVEARYDLRPSAWVEPIGDWGAGSVQLFEIPSLVETNDNIVAYWQPKDPLAAGGEFSFVYRLHWCALWPTDQASAPVSQVEFSGSGVAVDYAANPPKYDPNFRLYVIEYAGALTDEEFTAEVKADSGKVDHVSVSRNPVNNMLRLNFRHDATGLDVAELRAELKRGSAPAGETWLFRWTRT